MEKTSFRMERDRKYSSYTEQSFEWNEEEDNVLVDLD